MISKIFSLVLLTCFHNLISTPGHDLRNISGHEMSKKFYQQALRNQSRPNFVFFWHTYDPKKTKLPLFPKTNNFKDLNQCFSNWYHSPVKMKVKTTLANGQQKVTYKNFYTAEHFIMYKKVQFAMTEYLKKEPKAQQFKKGKSGQKQKKQSVKLNDLSPSFKNASKDLEKIIRSKSPAVVKNIAKKHNAAAASSGWHKNKRSIAKKFIYKKFSTNKKLKRFLLSTRNAILMEASPYDAEWGIGRDQNGNTDPKGVMVNGKQAVLIKGDPRNPRFWSGANILGEILMEVREELKQSPKHSH